jgi:hypothetical protein
LPAVDEVERVRLVLQNAGRTGVQDVSRPVISAFSEINLFYCLQSFNVTRISFSGDARLETLPEDDDNRVDEAGAIAKMLGEDSAGEPECPLP